METPQPVSASPPPSFSPVSPGRHPSSQLCPSNCTQPERVEGQVLSDAFEMMMVMDDDDDQYQSPPQEWSPSYLLTRLASSSFFCLSAISRRLLRAENTPSTRGFMKSTYTGGNVTVTRHPCDHCATRIDCRTLHSQSSCHDQPQLSCPLSQPHPL